MYSGVILRHRYITDNKFVIKQDTTCTSTRTDNRKGTVGSTNLARCSQHSRKREAYREVTLQNTSRTTG